MQFSLSHADYIVFFTLATVFSLQVEASFYFVESVSELHRISPGARAHPTLRTLKSIASCFLCEDQLPALFLAHPLSGCILPYHLTNTDRSNKVLLDTLRTMSRDRVLPPDAEPSLVHRLVRVGAIINPMQLLKRTQIIDQAIADAVDSWSEHSLALLPRVLSSPHVRALQFYFSAKNNWDRVHHVWTWNEPIATAINIMLSPLATLLVSERNQLLSAGPVTHLYAPNSVLGAHLDTGIYYHSMSIYLETGSSKCAPLCVVRRSGSEVVSEYRLQTVVEMFLLQ
jgi:hypothetical protein